MGDLRTTSSPTRHFSCSTEDHQVLLELSGQSAYSTVYAEDSTPMRQQWKKDKRRKQIETLRAEGNTFINRSVGEVFEFLCNPDIDPVELTPFEDWVTERSESPGIGSVLRTTVEFAARELDCVARCVDFEPPHRLGMRLEGDLEGMQSWHLASEDAGTRAHLSIEMVKPEWLPAYLQDEKTAGRWCHMLVDQTLVNVKTTLEKSAPSA